MSNRERGELFAKRVGEYLARLGHKLRPEYSVDVGLNSGIKKSHAFDFGNEQFLIECKFYNWTAGGNNPSGKIATLNEAMVYFHATPASYTKKLFVSRTDKKGVRRPETLAEYYVRLNGHFIPDGVEVWEFDERVNEARKLV